ncbi:hypothetical protein SARC_02710 [Sphaeroforma arctica JP610]|uniref:Uncharacterized protein n=1 Tax=Sphaeroforma arctica JP610 TaxID=667725 RepID=A0A0L0G7U3_9EUKA|nr:hypothetical protein SARC_02710 [Sphaeroforma arctica JP610]KNC85082.1 hypothetical protein SARC_02710 [Sphaeroforma arctica JP610]|eukprot:XP_014158984.1 hypothetical protein SARC_02710 [Sphaeroforma arctica JP610]
MLQQALVTHQNRLRQGESSAPPSESNESSPPSAHTWRGSDRGQERQNDGGRVLHQQGQTRPRQKRRPYRQSRQHGSNAQSKTDQLLQKQQKLLDRYEQRLQHLQRQAERPRGGPTTISPDQGQEESISTSQPPEPVGENERLEFRIPGSAARYGVGYQAPAQGMGPQDSDTPRAAISLQDSAHAQQRAAQDPHGPEALDNRRDRLSETVHSQQQNRRFEAEALRDSITEHTVLSTPTTQVSSPTAGDKVTPPRPECIAADRQALHARMLRLSEELCRAVEADEPFSYSTSGLQKY